MHVLMKYMMKSMKPTLFTMLPIILIFGWLNAHMAYYPLLPGQEFTATLTFDDGFADNVEVFATEGLMVVGDYIKSVEDSIIIYTFKGPAGEYLLDFKSGGKSLIDKPKVVTIRLNYKVIRILR